MRRRWVGLLIVWLLALAALVTIVSLTSRPAQAPPVVAVNEVVQASQARWPAVSTDDLPAADVLPDVTVVAADGRVVASRGERVTDPLQAVRSRAFALDIVVGDGVVGKVYLRDPSLAPLETSRRDAALVAAAGIVLIALAATAWLLYLEVRVAAPFARARAFAADLAAGRLDAPLPIDRGHVLGPFSEAFDVLRRELAEARGRERSAREDRKTVVAQLGHDIRTPLSSICATAELLRLTETDPQRQAKLDVITAKAGQIDALAQELFAAGEDELAALSVVPLTRASSDIPALLASADAAGQVTSCEIPDVLVRFDERRLVQVFDNVLGNAAKYAGTPVRVSGHVEGELLVLIVHDDGPGVDDDEVVLMTSRFVRGRAAVGIPGSGLGLFTARRLVQGMGGDLACRNVPGGFEVEVALPLAGR